MAAPIPLDYIEPETVDNIEKDFVMAGVLEKFKCKLQNLEVEGGTDSTGDAFGAQIAPQSAFALKSSFFVELSRHKACFARNSSFSQSKTTRLNIGALIGPLTTANEQGCDIDFYFIASELVNSLTSAPSTASIGAYSEKVSFILFYHYDGVMRVLRRICAGPPRSHKDLLDHKTKISKISRWLILFLYLRTTVLPSLPYLFSPSTCRLLLYEATARKQDMHHIHFLAYSLEIG